MTLTDKLEALLGRSNALPWRWGHHDNWRGEIRESMFKIYTDADPERALPVLAMDPQYAAVTLNASCDLIVAAVNALPRLLAVVKAAEALLADDSHTGDANCMAGDCDSCAVHEREAELRAAIADCASHVFQRDGVWYALGCYGSGHDTTLYRFVANAPREPADPVCDPCLNVRLASGDIVVEREGIP